MSESRWYKGNLHSHTTESDGDESPEKVAKWYAEHGYDFLVLSDHNCLTILDDNAGTPQGGKPLMIPGEELTVQLENQEKAVYVNSIRLSRAVEPINAAQVLPTIQANVNAILEADRKVNRALKAGAMAVGAKVDIQTFPGYLPLQQNQHLADVFEANAVSLVGEGDVGHVSHRTGSTDMGDVSHLMPAIHPYVGGATGLGHGADYVVRDYNLAVITAAKALAGSVVDLLADGAAQGGRILSNHKPDMTKGQYLSFMRNLAKQELFEYDDSAS